MQLSRIDAMHHLAQKAIDRNAKAFDIVMISMWGMLIAVKVYSTTGCRFTRRYFRRFLSEEPEGVADFTLELYEPAKLEIGDELVRHYNGQTVGEQVMLVGPNCFAIVDINRPSGVAFIEQDNSSEPFYYQALLRGMGPVLARIKQGAIVHGSAIVENEESHLFIGESGAGKSTVVRLLEPRMALSDEAIFIAVRNGQLECWGSPYGREHAGTNRAVKLKNCYFLKKDRAVFVRRLSPVKALPRLLTHLWGMDNLNLTDAAAIVCMQVAEEIPCYELHFQKNSHFWASIEAEMVLQG